MRLWRKYTGPRESDWDSVPASESEHDPEPGWVPGPVPRQAGVPQDGQPASRYTKSVERYMALALAGCF